MNNKVQWVLFWLIVIGLFVMIGYLGRKNYGSFNFWGKIPGTQGPAGVIR